MRVSTLGAGFALLAACAGPAPATPPTPDLPATPDATLIDAAPDVPAMDLPDVLRRACTRNDDCVFAVEGSTCDLATGRCVACVPSDDRCPMEQYCVAATNTCAPGCRDDRACTRAVGDGGVMTRRCDLGARRCVQCVANDDCPLGNLCQDNLCVPGCSPTRACAAGRTCCEGACVDTAVSVTHCGACGAACSVANGAPECRAGACAVGRCAAAFADCDRLPANGCEVDTAADRAHCGACGAACEPRPNGVANCVGGRCERRCAEGFADCDGATENGCEVDTRDSLIHCGACGAACATGVCRDGVCQPARCDDTVRNGGETDVDCGGPAMCARCALGRRCSSGSDCASGECFGGICGDLDGSSCAGVGPVLGPRAGFAEVRVHARSSAFRGVGSLVGDGGGTLWAHDPYGNGASGDRVLRINADGTVATVVAPPGFTTCTSQQIARLPGGDLLLWNITSNTLARITPSGAVSAFSTVSAIGGAGSCIDSGVQGVLAGVDGAVTVTSPLRSAVIALRADGAELGRVTGIPASFRLAADVDGVLLNSNGAILRLSRAGARSLVFDAPAAGLSASAIRRDGSNDVYFAAGSMVLAVNGDGNELRLVLACAGSGVSDVIFDRATGATGTSLYLSTLGRTIEADDGDTLYELRR
jgi:hypothetical protein